MGRRLTGMRADNGASYQSLQGIADSVRQQLGLGTFDRVDCVALWDQIDDLRLPDSSAPADLFPLVVEDGHLADGIEGATVFHRASGEFRLMIPEAGYQALEGGAARSAFLVAHELGHGLLHRAELRRLDRLPHAVVGMYRAQPATHQPFEDTEWQANAFAASLLMPAAGVAQVIRKYGSGSMYAKATVTSLYGVSFDAATYRLDTVSRKFSHLCK